MYRVYDDRTNETLFSSENNLDCALFITENIGEESDDFEHVWIEKYEEAEANAKLIAAAPELLEAAEIGAKCLEIWLDSDECWCEGGCSCGKAERKRDLKLIRQAISKAKGESADD